MRLLILVPLLLAASPGVAQSPGEQAFQAAKLWTVHIKGSLNEPFSEDDVGSWYGSGLVVDAERGWVLTNAHVASHSYARLSLSFATGKTFPATRLYVDPYLDLAVLAYDVGSAPAPTATPRLECGSLPPVGHPVGAFGHPWGFRFTGTRGITSAITSRGGPDMLQTDAPINGGNSGGPLISLETGTVLGVSAAKIADEEVEGLGFAVPMPLACRILELMRAGRDPSPPDMLVDFAVDDGGDRTLAVANSRLPQESLAVMAGDTITAANGTAVNTQTELVDAMRGQLDSVTLEVRREGKIISLSGRWPAAPLVTARSGLMVSGALFSSADYLSRGLPAGEAGLMVHHVASGSEAESVDLGVFDRLIRVNGDTVQSLAELSIKVEEARAADAPLELLLMRIAEDGELFVYQRRYLSVDNVQTVGTVTPTARVADAKATPRH